MELASRLAVEERLASRLALLGAKQRRAILAALGEPPDFDRLTPEFWARLEKLVREEVAAEALIVYLLMLGQQWDDWQPLSGRLPVDVGTQGGAWSAGFGADQAEQWIATTRDRVEQLRSRQQATPINRLRGQLVDILGPNRIATWAVTMTTAAASGGSLASRDLLERRTGVRLAGVWRTEQDAKVCPICLPLGNTNEIVWREQFPGGPPAHPNCRCHLDFVVWGGRGVLAPERPEFVGV